MLSIAWRDSCRAGMQQLRQAAVRNKFLASSSCYSNHVVCMQQIPPSSFAGRTFSTHTKPSPPPHSHRDSRPSDRRRHSLPQKRGPRRDPTDARRTSKREHKYPPGHHAEETSQTTTAAPSSSFLIPYEPNDITELFGNLSINWYPGHMHAAKLALAEKVDKCHLVLEVRDARLPFSCTHPTFESLFANKKRIIIFNKSDLADPATFSKIRQHFASLPQPQHVMFMAGDPILPNATKPQASETRSAPSHSFKRGEQKLKEKEGDEIEEEEESESDPNRKPGDPLSTPTHRVNLSALRDLHRLIQQVIGTRRFSSVPPVVLIVGFPNTGKSSLINAFRQYSSKLISMNAGKNSLDPTKESKQAMQKGGKARAGPTPGLTRSISGFLVSAPASKRASQSSNRLPNPNAASPFQPAPMPLSLGMNSTSRFDAASDSLSQASEKLFLLDSPGIMLPYISSDHTGMKLGFSLSAVGCMSENIVGDEQLARFILWRLNQMRRFQYVDQLRPFLQHPTNDLSQLILAIWRKRFGRSTNKNQSALFRQFTKMERERIKQMQQSNTSLDGVEEETDDNVVDAEAKPLDAAIHPSDASHENSVSLNSTPGYSVSTPVPTQASVNVSSSRPANPQRLVDLTSEELRLCTQWWIQNFRSGELGRLTMDPVPGFESRSNSKRAPTQRRH